MKNKYITLVLLALVFVLSVNAQNTDFFNSSRDVDVAYTARTGNYEYGKVNLQTGVFSSVGEVGIQPFPMAEAFVDGEIWRAYSDKTIVKVNPADGTVTSLGSLLGIDVAPLALAYDFSKEKIFLAGIDDAFIIHICTMNKETLELTEIGTTEKMIVAFDIASDGFLYGPEVVPEQNGNLCKIDTATAEVFTVGSVGLSIESGQDVSYDILTDKLYTITHTNNGDNCKFGTYNLVTGVFEQISDMGSPQQHATFVICKSPLQTAPEKVSNFTVTPDEDGLFNIDFSWTNPTTLFDGSPLTNLTSTELYINNELVYTNTTSAEGEEVSVTDFDVSSFGFGKHYFKVLAKNPEGSSLSVVKLFFVGVDIVVSEIELPIYASIGELVVPKVKFQNLSELPRSFNVVLTNNDDYSETVSVENLSTEEIQAITFPNWIPQQGGDYEFVASVSFENDAVEANNQITKTCPVYSQLITYDFQDSIMPNNFTLIDGDCGWEVSAYGSSAYFGIPLHTTYAYVNDDQCGADMSDVWMILPDLNFSNVSFPFLEFLSYAGADLYTIKVSTDGENWTDFPLDLPAAPGWWNKVVVDLLPFANQPRVKIAFHYSDNGFQYGQAWAVDDINLPGELFVGVNKEKETLVDVYPNPADDVLKIDAEGKQDLEMFNSAGKLVLKQTFTNSTLLDVSSLVSGLYFVHLKSAKRTDSYKVVVK